MRAITVRQPWAWAIAAGYKTVENRSRGTRYRGPLAIHAGGAWSNRGARDQRVIDAYKAAGWLFAGEPGHLLNPETCDPAECTFSAILAVAKLVDSHPDEGCCRPWGESTYQEGDGRVRVQLDHLVLEDSRPLAEPISARGQLGLWTPASDIVEAITEQIGATA